MNTFRMMAAVLLMATAQGASAAAQCERTLQVGAWNIEWLGNAERGKRKAQVPENLASYIRASGVDVLALNEISVTGRDPDGQARNQQLDEALARLGGEGGEWKYRLTQKREGVFAPQDQWAGVAWNAKKVRLVGEPWRLDNIIDSKREDSLLARLGDWPDGPVIWKRWPEVFKFSAGPGLTDFLVVPIHLKSNRGGREITADARAYDLELLFKALSSGAGAMRDADLVVLGDSNMLSAREPASAFLSPHGMKDCNAEDVDTYISLKAGQSDAPFDRIFLPVGQPETRQSCSRFGNPPSELDFKVIQPTDWKPEMTRAEFRDLLSDHKMVKTGICVLADDD